MSKNATRMRALRKDPAYRVKENQRKQVARAAKKEKEKME